MLGYRPIPQYYPFVDKRVTVTGHPYSPGRDTQHVLATHFQLISMAFAPGETPYAEPPTELPAPPLLRTAEAIYARDGLWGQVVGRLIALADDPDTMFYNAQLELQDGSVVDRPLRCRRSVEILYRQHSSRLCRASKWWMPRL